MKHYWRCVYCKPREAKVAKFYLEKGGFETFYPLIKEKKRVAGKIKEIHKELFPNYLFVRFSVEDYRTVKYTKGVSRVVLGDNGEPAVVDDEIIEAIKGSMQDGFVVLEEKGFKKGEKVLIKDGPFKGFEAVFLKEIKPRDRVLILLKTITGELKLEIDYDKLK